MFHIPEQTDHWQIHNIFWKLGVIGKPTMDLGGNFLNLIQVLQQFDTFWISLFNSILSVHGYLHCSLVSSKVFMSGIRKLLMQFESHGSIRSFTRHC